MLEGGPADWSLFQGQFEGELGVLRTLCPGNGIWTLVRDGGPGKLQSRPSPPGQPQVLVSLQGRRPFVPAVGIGILVIVPGFSELSGGQGRRRADWATNPCSREAT